MSEKPNFDDFCIRVDEEELDCTGDFQCDSCGAHVDGDLPARGKNLAGNAVYFRKCPQCEEQYQLKPWTEE